MLFCLILFVSIMPAPSIAGTEMRTETADYWLDTVYACESFIPCMILHAAKAPETEVILTITYFPNKIALLICSTGLGYHGEPPSEETQGKIEYRLKPGDMSCGGVVGSFTFVPTEQMDFVNIYLEAKTADGSPLRVKDGSIRFGRSDRPLQAAQDSPFILAPEVGLGMGIQDNLTLGMTKSNCSLAAGCALTGYRPDGTPLNDKDRIGTGTILSVLYNGNEIVDQYVMILMGDVDGDGAVNATDALLALQHSVRLATLSDLQMSAANCCLDESSEMINASDALTILQYSVGLIPSCIHVNLQFD